MVSRKTDISEIKIFSICKNRY